MKKTLLLILSLSAASIFAQNWTTTGNSGTNPANNFIGTTDDQPLIFKTNNNERIRIKNDAIEVLGTTRLFANTTNKDLFQLHNDLENANNVIDLLFMRYSKYQPNNPSVMTISGLTEPTKYEVIFNVRTNGNIGMGVANPQYKLDVAGKSSFSDNMRVDAKIDAKEIKVTQTPTADFVFEKDYNLPKLEEVEKHIKDKKHLPEIASAKVMEKEGVNVGEFQIKLLQKIEELTLYSIEQNKKLKLQSEKLEKLEKQVETFLSEKK